MKFALSWLKEHLDTDEPLETLAAKRTMIGLWVESIEDKTSAQAPSDEGQLSRKRSGSHSIGDCCTIARSMFGICRGAYGFRQAFRWSFTATMEPM